MKTLIIHNRYALTGRGSGEEVMVDAISNLLKEKGHDVSYYFKDSLEIEKKVLGKIWAFFSGIYNFQEQKKLEKLLKNERPEFVFVQNVFPLLSPSVLVACKKYRIPVVMRCPNYRLVCPNGLFMTKGAVCEACANRNEFQCVLNNCEENIFKSIGYALRNCVARKLCLFKNNVDIFMVLTEFAKRKLVENGFSADRIQIISGFTDSNHFEPDMANIGSYVGFAGRVSHEKGVDVLLKVAENNPDIPFRVAGKYDGFETMVNKAPKNVEFLGQLNETELKGFYRNSRMMVSPSRWYEGLPVVIIEAMLFGRPVVCSALGGMPELVNDRVTGLLCKPDDITDFSQKIVNLWNDIDTCLQYGLAGRKKAEIEYNAEAFYSRLLNAVDSAKLRHKNLSRYPL